MNRSHLAATATLLLAAPLAALAAPDVPAATRAAAAPVHVVTARDTYRAALPGRQARILLDHNGRALAVAELDPSAVITLAQYVHDVEHRCGGFFAFASREQAEAFVARDRLIDATRAPAAATYTIDNPGTVTPWLDAVDATNIYGTIASLAAFQNRFYSTPHGHDAALWIRDTWQALAAGRSDVTAELFTDCSNCSTQPSVILTVAGNELADEVVVIGAHLDSVNWNNASNPNHRAPGADDDASGIATVTEIIRIALADGWRPQRTVKFMGYAAEEVGLNGSEAIASRYDSDGIDVVGVLQLDMTNYKAGAANDLRFITDNSDTALLAYFGQLFDTYLAPRGLVRGAVECGYGCSDHASWSEHGFAAGMAFEAGRPPSYPGDMADFPYIHTMNDTLANMNDTAAPSAPFAQFGLAFLGELAKTHVTTNDVIFVDGFEQ